MGILSLCLDSKTQSCSPQILSLVPVSLIQHPKNQEKQFQCYLRAGGNSRGKGEGNLFLDDS